VTPLDPERWPPALAVLVLAFAVHRVTRLLVGDKITEPLRLRLGVDRDGQYRPWIGYLVTCPWCVSVYVATAAVLAAALLPWPVVAWPALAAACSSVTGLLAAREGGDG
jgi:hypothetical protein